MNKTTVSCHMLEKGKISSLQLSFLMLVLMIATIDVFLPAYVAQEAKRDAWISVILGTAAATVIIYIFLLLGLRYPEKTLLQYACDILGKPLGKAVGLVYIYFFLMAAWTVTRELGELFLIAYNPDSPMIVYSIVVIMVAAYAVTMGLEVIARINELFLPLGLIILIFIPLINIPNMDFKNFLPVLADGIKPAIRGSILIQAWIIEAVVVLQLIPFVSDRAGIKKNIFVAVLILGLAMEAGVLTIAVYGQLTEHLMFPALLFVRLARLGQYIEKMDILIIGVWTIGIFLKITIFYYVSVLSISQFFGFRSYRYMIIPAGVLIIVLSIASADNIAGINRYIQTIFPFFSLTVSFVIPALLLLISTLRSKTEKSPKSIS